MRNPNGCRVVLLLSPAIFLLLPIGIVTFALERISNALITSPSTRNTGFWGTTSSSGVYGFKTGPTIAILGACVLVYIVSAIDAFGLWELRKVEGTARHQRVWSWVILISNLVMAGVSAGVFGYATMVQNNEDKEQPLESIEDLRSYDFSVTRESWACEINNFYENEDWARPACGMAKATRFLLIPMAVSALLVLVSLWVLMRDRGGLKWLVGGKGRYAGFANVYELRPTSPGAQRVPPPQAPWLPHPDQQWSQQTHQWPQQPMQQWIPQPYQAVPQQPVDQAQETEPKVGQQVVFR